MFGTVSSRAGRRRQRGQTGTFRPITITGTYYISQDDFVRVDLTNGAFTTYLPPAASRPGGTILLEKTDSTNNALTVSRQGPDSIIGLTAGGQSTFTIRRQGDSYRLVSDGVQSWCVVDAFASALGFASANGDGGSDYTTTSTTFVDVDATNLKIVTANALQNDILKIEAALEAQADASGHNVGVTFNIAGTDVGDTLGLAFSNQTLAAPFYLLYFFTMPSNSAVTIKLRYSISAGTATIYNRAAVVRPRMSVVNLGPAAML